MREIKFRAKLSHSSTWIEGNLVYNKYCEPYIIPKEDIEPDGHHLIVEDKAFWVIPKTVCQFATKDINDKEAFENDVLSNMESGAARYLIKWNQEHLCFGLHQIVFIDNKLTYGFQFTDAENFIKSKGLKVIGNIIDNPDYLKTSY